MSKRQPPYPLAAVLENLLAERQRQQGGLADALAEVQTAQSELETAQRRRAEVETRLNGATTAMIDAVNRGVTASDLQRRQGYVETCRCELTARDEAVEACMNQLRSANDHLTQCRAELAEADRRVKLQERHRENWQGEHRREQQRKARNQEDEVGRLLHERRMREP